MRGRGAGRRRTAPPETLSEILEDPTLRSSGEKLTGLRRELAEDGTVILGTVLNDWDPKAASGGYYGYHRGYYHRRYYHRPSD